MDASPHLTAAILSLQASSFSLKERMHSTYSWRSSNLPEFVSKKHNTMMIVCVCVSVFDSQHTQQVWSGHLHTVQLHQSIVCCK